MVKELPLVKVEGRGPKEALSALLGHLGAQGELDVVEEDGVAKAGPWRLARRGEVWVLGHVATPFTAYSSAEGLVCAQAVVVAAGPTFRALWLEVESCAWAMLYTQGAQDWAPELAAILRPVVEKLVWPLVRGQEAHFCGLVFGGARVCPVFADAPRTDAQARALLVAEASDPRKWPVGTAIYPRAARA